MFSISASEGEILNVFFMSLLPRLPLKKAKPITLSSRTQFLLDEVVVVVMVRKKKVNLTLFNCSFKDEVNQPVTNAGQLLYGRFSGFN
jgi:hypothetical protein